MYKLSIAFVITMGLLAILLTTGIVMYEVMELEYYGYDRVETVSATVVDKEYVEGSTSTTIMPVFFGNNLMFSSSSRRSSDDYKVTVYYSGVVKVINDKNIYDKYEVNDEMELELYKNEKNGKYKLK